MGRTTPKFSQGYLNCHLIHGSLCPPESPPNSISVGSAIFAQLTNMTNRQTHRPTMLLFAAIATSYAMRVMQLKMTLTGSELVNKVTTSHTEQIPQLCQSLE